VRRLGSALIGTLFTDLTNLSAYAFKFGDRGGSRITSIPSRAINVRNASEYLVSRSMIKCRLLRSTPSLPSVRLLATCNIHASFGFVVIPPMTTLRVARSIKKRT
jgi:hypothetical protein